MRKVKKIKNIHGLVNFDKVFFFKKNTFAVGRMTRFMLINGSSVKLNRVVQD